MESTADTLADTLRSHLSRPLRLEADPERFVTATSGDAEAETLRAALADTTASEAETLLELLLFPDTAFQVHIEPLLSQLNSAVEQERYLCACLRQPSIDLTLEIDDADGLLRLPLTSEFLDRFVTRLKIGKHWPAPLDRALTQHLNEGEQMRVRVMLRNTSVELGDSFAEICGRFLAALTSSHRDFWPALSLVIQLAAEFEAATDPFELLADHKQRAFQMVEQQREFEHRLQRSNIETLMGQGQRVPTLAKADALKQMRIIDAVSQALFGRTTYFQPVAFG
jgi:hypothetical protein